MDWRKYVVAGADAVRHGARSRRRVLLAAAGVVVLAAGVTAIVVSTGGGPSWKDASRDSSVVPQGWQTTSYRWGARLHHPPAWGSYPYFRPSIGGPLTLLYLSTQQLHKPCIHAGGKHPHVIGTCAPLLDHLDENGVLIKFDRTSSVDSEPIRRLPGTPTALAGRAAKLRVVAPDRLCASAGGKTLMDVAIGASAKPTSIQTWDISACLGPKDIAANKADMLAMVDTATLRYAGAS